MNFKVKKNAKAASAVALSALMASTMFAGVTASAAVSARPLNPDTITNVNGDNLVYTVGGWFKPSDCYLVNGKYYPKGTVNFTSTYKEYTDGTVLIDGYVYNMKDCTYRNGRYYAVESTPVYKEYYDGYYYYNNYVYYNGKYYHKSDCYYSNGYYYPKSGAVAVSNPYYYYNLDYSTYKEYDTYIVINGYRFDKTDCYFDTTYNRYYPKNGYGYYTGKYYYNGQYYTSYTDYLRAIGYFNTTTSTTSSVSESDPFIYGNEKKKGWTVIINTIYSSKKGSTVTIDMNETSVISKKLLKAIEGKNVNIKLVMKNGAVWTFNGKDIDENSIRSVDASVKYNTNRVPAILRQKASKGQGSYCEITVGSDSAYLGFDGTLATKFNVGSAGKTAKIYRYDSARNVLISVDEAKINYNGYATFNVVNTGTYFIVISK